jgi:hypothetical protein
VGRGSAIRTDLSSLSEKVNCRTCLRGQDCPPGFLVSWPVQLSRVEACPVAFQIQMTGKLESSQASPLLKWSPQVAIIVHRKDYVDTTGKRVLDAKPSEGGGQCC